MRLVSKTAVLAGVVLASIWGVSRIGLVLAQEADKPAKSAQGGLLAKADRHQFEVFFYPTGVRVFPQGETGSVIDASNLAGTATFYHPNSPKPWFSRPLHGSAGSAGRALTSLDLAMDLSKVPPMGARVTFEVTGLPNSPKSGATFTVPFEFVKTAAESPQAHSTATQRTVAASPRYVYGPGYDGYGYYDYPVPRTRSARRSGLAMPLSGYGRVPAASPSFPLPYLSGGHAVSILPSTSGSNATVGSGQRDWTTWRDLPLAKP